jgi:hypothetical protein
VRRTAWLALAGLAILASFPTTAAANPPAVERVEIHLQKTTYGQERAFRFLVYPQKGTAVIDTSVYGARGPERYRGVTYAFAIPTTPFEGTLDLTIPGLGRIDGTVSSDGEGGSGCDRSYVATFSGHLDFRGSGGYETWKATRAEASVFRACDPYDPKPATLGELFGAVQEYGPGLSGPAWFRFLGRSRDHALNFIAWSNLYRGEGDVQFVALDRELLPGEVMLQRWVDRPGVPAKKTIEVGPGGDHPATVVFRPPAPFFGTGRYDRRTHSLTGSLGAEFLGRRMRLAHPPQIALLEDEEPQPTGRVQ